MAIQQAVKSYPLLRWLLGASAVLVVVGLFASRIVTEPNAADTNTLLLFVGIAILLPFLALAKPRREVITIETPTDSLAGRPKEELEGILAELEVAKKKGELDEARYKKARDRVVAALKAKA